MTSHERDTIRELSTIVVDLVSGGVCQCGSDANCVQSATTSTGGTVYYNCSYFVYFGGIYI
jgi:hypothetical protein